ncbi:hypothetical protein Q0M94_26000 (plasmid) [Deinococcus radiomollis]|uniref:hypothetical protein n=1 Tax=Deinococcus radiomollis TaxID=468916 RepID=UPI0038922E70
MDLSKLTVAVFDVFAYILPGLVLLMALSLFEATFLKSGLIPLDRVAKASALALIASYFLGQLAHAFAGWLLIHVLPELPNDRKGGFRKDMFNHTRQRVIEVFNIDVTPFTPAKLQTLEVYQLADSYIATKEKVSERDSLIAREGFAKTSLGAFLLSALSVLSTVMRGGLHWRLATGSGSLSVAATLIVGLLLLLIAAVFWRRYVFFHGLKVTSTYALFLALTTKTVT